MDKKVTMEDLAPLIHECLNSGGSFKLTVTGSSMAPTLWPGRDSVVLTKSDKIKKRDIIFYLRDNGTYVLHRIIGVKGNDFVLCGDNQHIRVYPIRPDQVIAKVTDLYRNGRHISAKSLRYRLYVYLWCISIKIRPLVCRVYLKLRNR